MRCISNRSLLALWQGNVTELCQLDVKITSSIKNEKATNYAAQQWHNLPDGDDP